jgi:hypothetical protein
MAVLDADIGVGGVFQLLAQVVLYAKKPNDWAF